jgi:hypothetical protein
MLLVLFAIIALLLKKRQNESNYKVQCLIIITFLRYVIAQKHLGSHLDSRQCDGSLYFVLMLSMATNLFKKLTIVI